MRKFLRDCLIAALFFLPFSAISQAQIQKIYLSPKAAASAKQSSFVDSMHFIPLDHTQGLDIDGFTNVQVTKRYFMVIDLNKQSIQLFGRDGHYIKQISYKKLGQTFYPAYNEITNQIVFFGDNKNYALTPKDRVQIKMDLENPRNKKYFKKYRINLNDTILQLEKADPDETDIVRAYPLYGDYSWSGQIVTSPLYKDTLDYEMKIYKNKHLIKSYFPYNRVDEPKYLFKEESAYAISTSDPHVSMVSRPFCDTIYRMTKDSLTPAFQLVLPMENSLPPTFFTKPFKSKTERENFERGNSWVFRKVSNFYETPRLILFSVSYFNNHDTYVYQKDNRATYKVRSIKPDSSQFNLQVLADYNLQRQGDRFYKAQKAGDIVSFFEKNPTAQVPAELVEFLKTKPNPGTPVVIEFKLKNTL